LQNGWQEYRFGGKFSKPCAALTLSVTQQCRVRLSLMNAAADEVDATGYAMKVKEGDAQLFPTGWASEVLAGGCFEGLLFGAKGSHGSQQTTGTIEMCPGRAYRVEIRCVSARLPPCHTHTFFTEHQRRDFFISFRFVLRSLILPMTLLLAHTVHALFPHAAGGRRVASLCSSPMLVPGRCGSRGWLRARRRARLKASSLAIRGKNSCFVGCGSL
jgi:hypothetical protein